MATQSEVTLADELITLVEQRTAPEAALLRRRAERALTYMDKIVTPNHHTLSHIRRYLTGGYDNLEV